METGEGSTYHPNTDPPPALTDLVVSVGSGSLCFGVCVWKGWDMENPQVGVICRLRLFLSAKSLISQCFLRSGLKPSHCSPSPTPLVLLWVHALDSWGPSRGLYVHPPDSDSDIRDETND